MSKLKNLQSIGFSVVFFRLVLFFLVLFFLLIFDFGRRTFSNYHDEQLPGVAVVFTGQFNRLAKGFELLDSGDIDRLVVSGFNPNAGLTFDKLGYRFKLPQHQFVSWLAEGKLVLRTQANSTFENVIETRRVFTEYPSNSLILITGQCHMPRASALLEAELRNVDVLRMPVPGGCNSAKAIGLEFLKYVYSRFYVLRRFLTDIQSFLSPELN